LRSVCDLLRADSATDKTVWAFNGRSNSVSVMDAASNAVIATVPLPGKPEFPQVVLREESGRDMLWNSNEAYLFLSIAYRGRSHSAVT
jgi:YVTN family beta-propeller protein